MDLQPKEIDLINNYINTLERNKCTLTIHQNYLKIPYIEKYIIHVSKYHCNEKIIEFIINRINNHRISNEDIYFCLQYYFPFSKEDKSRIQQFIHNDSDNDVILMKCKANSILFAVKYYQFFHIVFELLHEEEEHKLFFYFYVLIQEENIKKYCREYFHLRLIYAHYKELIYLYQKIMDIFSKNEIIKEETSPINFFKKTFFIQWYKLYKEYIQNDLMKNIVEKYELKKSYLKRLLCSDFNC